MLAGKASTPGRKGRISDIADSAGEPKNRRTFTDLGRCSFTIATDTTVAQFDAARPEDADYVIVPA
ncbi:hypothetical protein [Xanthomonas campestris]|uniref:hypothetical protein n=1 Tax=Xanthomonas campestris TaxID=339 RepID=UPI000E32B484|nr:hypothetical protein [Xanthomonas campestris]MEA9488184.1 hypothetical protein [Xanthomonas campestris]MEA9507071.1 hypothetical protein [Xanthomonas campestris]MEA9574023.1 hypothetical protein [Xanthomonas campestris]MEB2112886.1 hypothetical protein [Xanthomonas campestris pv. campestris]RFF76061.1 hypothetical protein D0A39_02685 [Xanthomonas campestris pv. campestris]